jgi:serine protease Do
MAARSSVKISAALAIVVACPIGLATATGTIGVNASSAQDWVAWLSGAGARKTKDTARTRGQAASFANAVDMVKPAVITVRAKRRVDTSVGEQSAVNPPDEPHGKSSPGRRRGAPTSLGSGFFVTADGYAVTNNHVTEGSEVAEIVADDQKTYTAKVVAADLSTDIALLKVDGRNDFAHVKFADQAPRIGDRIFAVGNPFGLGGTVTAGIVSARDRSIGSSDHSALSKEQSSGSNAYEDLIQIDAAINRGSSGGPSFDTEGNVIGVNTMIFSPTGGSIGIAFAIPAETVRAVVAQLMEKGSVTRGWLGVQFQPLTPAIAGVLGLKKARGALVAEPLSDGPAKKAGIVAGDVIDSVNGEAVKDNRDLSRKMIGLAPGISVNLGVFHDGEEKTVAVTLGEPPPTKEALASRARAAHFATAPPTSDLGLKLAPAIDTAGPENHGVGNRGLIVIGIDPSGRAADLGIEAGDIILEVGGKAVQTPDDVRNALNQARDAGRRAALMRLKSGDAMRFVAVPLDPA